jgi:hypothetical protein
VWIELAREKHRGGLGYLVGSAQLGHLAAQRLISSRSWLLKTSSRLPSSASVRRL